MKRIARLLFLLVIVATAAVGGVFYWGYLSFVSSGPSVEAKTFVVPKGAGLNQIALLLRNAGLIEEPDVFIWGARLSGDARIIKAGEYAFEATVSPRRILGDFTAGKTVLRRVTVPEGLSSVEVAMLLNATDALEGTVSAPAEGSVLPETYSYQYGESRADVLARMKRSMRETVVELWATRAGDLPLARPEDAVVLASIVEKETAVAAERPRVAAVFINRLRRGMRLQSDPTVVYGLTQGNGPLGRRLTREDLEMNHPFNTYRIAGLPPTPIANPGREALAAVMNPLTTAELYFVADGTGGHVFAKTLAEHNRNVAKWRKLQRESKP